jgi:mono/diheme cytochrome c family protein
MSWLKFLVKKKYIFFIIFLISVFWAISSSLENTNLNHYTKDQDKLDSGEKLYIQNCASCHALKEDGMGPPLGGITSFLSKEALISFVQNPSLAISSGNKRANYLLNRYNNIMPSFAYLSPVDITNIFAYIDDESKKNGLTAFDVNLENPVIKNQRYASPIGFNGLVIELEEHTKIPIAPNRANRKGIATLRAIPGLQNTLLISDQMGKLYVSKNKETSVFLDVDSTFNNFIFEPGIGSGFGSFAIHPDYEKNGLFYTTHTETYLGKEAINKNHFPDSVGVGLQWVLTEWKVNNPKDLIFNGSRREIFRVNTPTTAHGIQDIGFNPYLSKNHPDYGLLYLGIGDGGSNNLKKPELADHKGSPLGSILRIDPLGSNSSNKQYGIPLDNPFFNEDSRSIQKEIFALGFRNPHRFCWDYSTGVMLVADIGEANIEEINIVKKGKHYGWSLLEGIYGIDMTKDAKTIFTATPEKFANYELPFATYDHVEGKAISGGFVYEGDIEALKNKYIFGDIVTGRLFYLDLSNNLKNNTINELKIYNNKVETSLLELSGAIKANLRIGYDENEKELFIMTKDDATIRRIVNAYYIEDNNKIK